jgi:hypothetical protein
VLSRRAFALIVTASISALVFLALARNYSETSGPLWNLAESADLIVLADVIEVSPDRAASGASCTRMPEGTDRVAHLWVLETWKGEPATLVDVPFNEFLKWPAPPSYTAGDVVVAFLKRTGREWTTVGMSSGVRRLRVDEIAAMRSRIRETVARQAPGAGAPRGQSGSGSAAAAGSLRVSW